MVAVNSLQYGDEAFSIVLCYAYCLLQGLFLFPGFFNGEHSAALLMVHEGWCSACCGGCLVGPSEGEHSCVLGVGCLGGGQPVKVRTR